METLDWSIVQSALLRLVLPGFGVAAFVLAMASLFTRSAPRRGMATSVALSAGLASGNSLSQLVPWNEFETGWRSLFWATLMIALSEPLMLAVTGRSSNRLLTTTTQILFALAISAWVTPWDVTISQPWVWCLLGLVIAWNWTTLNFLGEHRYESSLVPLALAAAWGITAPAVLILAHSARFAEMAILQSCALAGIGVVAATLRSRLSGIYAGPAVFIPGLMLAAALNTDSKVPLLSFVLVAILPGCLVFLRWQKLADWFQRHPVALIIVAMFPGVAACCAAIWAEGIG